MSEYRPHVKRNAMPPAIRDESILAGKMTPQKRAEWLRRQSSDVQEHHRTLAERYDLIIKAQERELLGWEKDPLHYKNWPLYCKCPAVDNGPKGGISAGSVDAHNFRFQKILESVDDGR